MTINTRYSYSFDAMTVDYNTVLSYKKKGDKPDNTGMEIGDIMRIADNNTLINRIGFFFR